MRTEHTPGPWRIKATLDDGHGNDKLRIGPEEAFKPFGGCGCCGSPWINGDTREQQIANAELIVAAPEMLEVLEAILNAMDGHGFRESTLSAFHRKRAEAVVAKARGQS